MSTTELVLECSSGEATARIGDKLRMSDKDGDWEIAGFGEHAGQPTVRCKSLSGVPSWLQRYVEEDGCVFFCGDSVAAALLTEQDGKRRDARGALLASAKACL
jgi:hypothetical protein